MILWLLSELLSSPSVSNISNIVYSPLKWQRLVINLFLHTYLSIFLAGLLLLKNFKPTTPLWPNSKNLLLRFI